MKSSMIGSTAKYITKRMTWSARVSSDSSKNEFIQVGKAEPVSIKALWEIYGEGLCPAALCSTKPGLWRTQCCDMRTHSDHKNLDSKAHTGLPERTGPNHKRTWSRVVELSNKIMNKKRKEK